jgi:uncharacterized 2Fe-2S/4Fe-4S cluster protein (DUF4445 family)
MALPHKPAAYPELSKVVTLPAPRLPEPPGDGEGRRRRRRG